MYEIINNFNEIKEYREKFLNILKKNTVLRQNVRIGDQGVGQPGVPTCNVYWSDEYHFWIAQHEDDVLTK